VEHGLDHRPGANLGQGLSDPKELVIFAPERVDGEAKGHGSYHIVGETRKVILHFQVDGRVLRQLQKLQDVADTLLAAGLD